MTRPYAAYVALTGLLVPTIFSLLLLVASVRNWHSSERYAEVVTKEKPSIATVVQILSHSLGLFQICALCTVISLSFQRYAASTPFSLDALRAVNSAFALRFDWNLPLQWLVPLVLFISFSLAPAAVWSGAVTPNVVAKNVTISFSIPSIGAVNHSDNPLFGGTAPGDGICPWITGDAVDKEVASFHNCLSKLSLLGSAASSSSMNTIPGEEDQKAHIHSKIDRSGYSFIGRSYGVGATVGLEDLQAIQSPLAYSFLEAGLQTDAGCTVNKSSHYGLHPAGEFDGVKLFKDYANGTLPDGLSANFGTNNTISRHFGFLPVDIFSWASAYNNQSKTTWFSLAAVIDDPLACTDTNSTDCGYGFSVLHQVQCQLSFTPKQFKLHVDAIGRTISVTPHEAIGWPSYADGLFEELTAEHSYISALDSDFGGSQLGHAIRSNVDVLRAYRNEASLLQGTLFNGVEDFLADMIDNSIIVFAQSRYYGFKEQRAVNADVSRNVVVYGEAKFIYAAVCLNLVVLIICGMEALRTKFWRGISNLDLLDTASIAVGASYGGTKLAARVQTLGTGGILLPGSRPSAQDFTGTVKVQLRDINGAMSAIEPVDRRSDTLSLLSTRRTSHHDSGMRREYIEVPSFETG